MDRLKGTYWLLVVASVLLGLLWLRGVSQPGTRVEQWVSDRPMEGGSDPFTLRLVSMNILHGFPRFTHLDDRLSALAEELGRLQPDLIALQEVPWVAGRRSAFERLAEHLTMNGAYFRANGNRRLILFEEGVAILSRYPIKSVQGVELLPRAGYFENRVALSAIISTPAGDLTLVTTHLSHSDEEVNHGQLESLIAHVSRMEVNPIIITGDFNASEDSPGILQASRVWLDVYRWRHPAGESPSCCIQQITELGRERLDRRIDYIFLHGVEGLRRSSIDISPFLDHPVQVSGGPIWVSDHTGWLMDWLWDQ